MHIIPINFIQQMNYLKRYPGNDYVDVIGFDIYQRNGNEEFMKDANNMLSMLDSIASDT